MKNQIKYCSLFTVLLITALLTGCASTSGNAPTLHQTRLNVDWPMTRYRNAVPSGQITTAQQQAVNEAYAKYEAAFKAALQVANNNDKAPTPANVGQAANQLLSILGSLSL